ncbi:helix-turn-helix transcriptional regulator [Bacillus sp. FSL K6-3431]|uniref:helix-turn-helix transcriptional regulator n=1 Tax=Bacillus sp. FSL K6-3431 TaxID=2921500 RepID=UPI0030F9710B
MKEFSHEHAEHWFHNPTPIEKAGGLWPIRAGQNKAKSNYRMGPRIITYYSLHFILAGEGSFSQNETIKEIQQGDIFCLLPNQTHQYSSNPDHPLRMFWLAFDGRQANPLLKRIGITNYSTHVKGILSEEITGILSELATHFKKDDEDDDLFGLSIMYKLFHSLSVQSKQKDLTPTPPRNWLQKSQEYMNMHFAENVSVKDVAKYVGIHRSYFTDSFVNEVGVTPGKYLLSLKMNRALELISEKAHTITEIALSLGYSDLYSFSRAFKNYYDVSPNQYLANK